jgi:hypothetical protein
MDEVDEDDMNELDDQMDMVQQMSKILNEHEQCNQMLIQKY